jgi:hypothetical protein
MEVAQMIGSPILPPIVMLYTTLHMEREEF